MLDENDGGLWSTEQPPIQTNDRSTNLLGQYGYSGEELMSELETIDTNLFFNVNENASGIIPEEYMNFDDSSASRENDIINGTLREQFSIFDNYCFDTSANFPWECFDNKQCEKKE